MAKVQYISVGGVQYKAELIADGGAQSAAEYVMLRSYAFKNNVLYDTDLYFVEKELLSLYINKKYNDADASGNENLTSGLLFPAVSVNGTAISLDIRQFNGDINPQYFDELASPKETSFLNSPLVYSLYGKNADGSFAAATVRQNVLRVYKPHTSKSQSIVLHCYAYINNIKVHVLCRDINWYEREENEKAYVHGENEHYEHHNFYTSYTDVLLPDLDCLFSNKIYYKENLNGGDVICFDTSSEDGKKMYERYKNSVDGAYVTLAAFELPFSIIKKEINVADVAQVCTVNADGWSQSDAGGAVWLWDGEENVLEAAEYVKRYVPDLMHTTRQAQQKHALTVQFVPYDSSYKYVYNNSAAKYWYDRCVRGFGKTKCLVMSDASEVQTTQFFTESRIRLKSRIGFNDDGQISVLNEFDYPLKEDKELFPDFNAAYEYYNGVDLSDYVGIVDDEDEDGWWDSDYEESMQCGAVFEIFADKFYKDRLYKETYGFNTVEETAKDGNGTVHHPVIEDFAFSLGGLFTDWSQWPGVTFLRCTFVDKYIGKKIYGNVCTLTKEQFKFLINDDTKNAKAVTTGTSLIRTGLPEYYPSDILKEENVMDKSRFNFLNNIRVNVIAPTQAPTQTVTAGTSQSGRGGAKIIYKPVFYKVHDVNSVKLRQGITQNVGVNLMDWMTKVETFKIVMNTVTLVEYARNDNYVIFNINTDKILFATGTDTYSGEYHVLNQDDEYITSGKWSVV